jgi:hypothetical protein
LGAAGSVFPGRYGRAFEGSWGHCTDHV